MLWCAVFLVLAISSPLLGATLASLLPIMLAIEIVGPTAYRWPLLAAGGAIVMQLLLVGSLLDKMALPKHSRGSILILAVVGGLAMGLESEHLPDYILSILSSSGASTWASLLALSGRVLAASFIVAAAASFVVIGTEISSLALVNLAARASPRKPALNFNPRLSALRPLLLLAMASLTLHLVSDFIFVTLKGIK